MYIPRTLDDLMFLVEERVPEGPQLEYKRELPASGKNDDLARDVASFANAGGGVIIYGVEEDPQGRAGRLVPFGLSGAPERVNQVAQALLDEGLPIDEILAIEQDGGKGYLVLAVPPSNRAPHFQRGVAFGRAGATTAPLSRRQIGELFAKLPGFAEEFGLVNRRPGRVRARLEQPQDELGYRHLVLENDGEGNVNDVDWQWSWASEPPERMPLAGSGDNFPVRLMPPGAEVRQLIIVGISDTLPSELVVSWKDDLGIDSSMNWPMSW